MVKEISKADEIIETTIIEQVILLKGLNRFVVSVKANNDDIKIRPVLKHLDGSFIDNLKYQLTIDEVDPK